MRRAQTIKEHLSRWRAVVGVMIATLLLLSGTALADQQDGERQGEEALGNKFRRGDIVTIQEDERIDEDLYVFAGQVRIEGTVGGDVMAAGGQIDVDGTVGGDLLAAAGVINVRGDVEGDARLTGGQVLFDGTVGEDLATSGGQLNVGTQGQIGADLLFATGETTMDGAVGGDLLGSTGTYRADGTVAGGERVTVPQPQQEPSLAQRALALLRRYVGIVAVGALLLWVAPGMLRSAAEQFRTRPLSSLGVGIVSLAAYVALMLALIVVMVVLTILFVLLGLGELVVAVLSTGIVSGALLSVVLLLVGLFIAQITVGLPIGRLAFARQGDQRSRLADLAALALGALVLLLLFVIPAGGGVLQFVTMLFGLGALLLAGWQARRSAPEKREQAPPAASNGPAPEPSELA